MIQELIKPSKGLKKQKKLSKYYGVQFDKRNNVGGEVVWYRVVIESNGIRYNAGSFLNEEHAGYAFNVAFNFISSGHYTIENNVNLTEFEKHDIYEKVHTKMMKVWMHNYTDYKML